MTQDLRSGKTTVAKLHQTYGNRSANPQGAFNYNNLDTLALARVVEAATKTSFSSFFAKTIAEPAGIQSQMAFGTDTDGVALTYGMAFATLQDWGRLGLYTLEAWHGKYGPCMMAYLREATDKQLTHQASREFDGYGYQFWTGLKGNDNPAFFMLGFGGQRVGVDPKTGGILVAFSYGPGADPINHFSQWIQRLGPYQ
jgi:CubicO group peptidase (beta-lactamase class C family)